MTDDNNNDFEIGDVENFSSKEQQFSHQILIMKCLTKCAENGSVEMVEGRVEHKIDKNGNVSTKYLPDTRKQFIESITTAKNFMSCDFDDDAKQKIKALLQKIQDNKNKWLDLEYSWWESVDYGVQQKLVLEGRNCIKGLHNQKLYFKDNSISEELSIWREVLEELNELTKRMNFYEQDTFTA